MFKGCNTAGTTEKPELIANGRVLYVYALFDTRWSSLLIDCFFMRAVQGSSHVHLMVDSCLVGTCFVV